MFPQLFSWTQALFFAHLILLLSLGVSLLDEDDVGQVKVEVAARKLQKLNLNEVGRHFGKRINEFISLSVQDITDDLTIVGAGASSTTIDASALKVVLRALGFEPRKEEVKAMEERFRAGGEGYGNFKKELFAAIWEFFAEVGDISWDDFMTEPCGRRRSRPPGC